MRAVAADNELPRICPLHRIHRPGRDLSGVTVGGEVCAHRHVVLREGGKGTEHHGSLCARECVIRAERAVAEAGDDAVFRRPDDSIGIPAVSRDIGEGVRRLDRRLTGSGIEDDRKHRAAQLLTRREGRLVHADHEAAGIHALDGGVRPVIPRHVGIRQRHAGLLRVIGGVEHLDLVAVHEHEIVHADVCKVIVDAKQPAGVLTLAKLGQPRAVRRSDRLHIAVLLVVFIGVALVGQHLLEHGEHRRALRQIADLGRCDPLIRVRVQPEGDADRLGLRIVCVHSQRRRHEAHDQNQHQQQRQKPFFHVRSS